MRLDGYLEVECPKCGALLAYNGHGIIRGGVEEMNKCINGMPNDCDDYVRAWRRAVRDQKNPSK